MFSTVDEILIWAKRGNKRKIYKFKCAATVKERFIELFNAGVMRLISDVDGNELLPVPFETNYGVTAGEEHFIISDFVLPQEIKDAIDAPDVIETYIPRDLEGKTEDGYDIRAILIAGKDDNGYYVAGQKFSQRQITVKKKGFGVFLSGDTFVEDNRHFTISVGEQIDCVFAGSGLIFEKYFDANGVFDLSEYYRAASQVEIDTFANSQAFNIADADIFAKLMSSIQMRKKVAKILDLGTLNDIGQIRENAQKVNLPINFTTDGSRINLPSDKKELKIVMAFLAEELYPGMFTNKTYLTNSTRQIVE